MQAGLLDMSIEKTVYHSAKGTMKKSKLPACVLPFLFGSESPLLCFFSPPSVKCSGDLRILCLESFLCSFPGPLSAEILCLIVTTPYPREFDVMLTSIAACGTYFSACLSTDRTPLMALFERHSANAADVLVYVSQ